MSLLVALNNSYVFIAWHGGSCSIRKAAHKLPVGRVVMPTPPNPIRFDETATSGHHILIIIRLCAVQDIPYNSHSVWRVGLKYWVQIRHSIGAPVQGVAYATASIILIIVGSILLGGEACHSVLLNPNAYRSIEQVAYGSCSPTHQSTYQFPADWL